MDQDLPERDICPLQLASLAQAGTLNEDKPPRQSAGKTLWLTLLASLLVHTILLTIWTTRSPDVKEMAPDPSLRITVNTAVKNTGPAETMLEQESPAMEEPVTSELPPPPENTERAETVLEQESPAMEEPITPEPSSPSEDTAATDENTQVKPRIDIHDLDIGPHHLPATSTSEPGNVFHPALRDQISEARTRRERLHNTQKPDLPSWQDASGKTWIDLGNGTCMRSAGDAREATKSWELPTRCKGQLTEGESMLRGMQNTLDSR